MFVFSFRVGGTFRILVDRRPSPIAIVAGLEKKKRTKMVLVVASLALRGICKAS